VPAAVVRAGLRIYPLDVDPETLELNSSDIEGLPEADLLCIVTGNLFGLANGVAGLLAAARSRGAFLVDDAAQALGASRDGRLAGTMADVGMYSLGRGKAIATLEGGLIVTDSDEIAEVIRDAAKNLPVPTRMHTAVLLAQLAAYSLLTRPRLYWIPNSLPFLKLGITEFAPDFRTEQSPRPMHALLPSLLAQLDRINASRRSYAALLRGAIAGSSRFTTPEIPPDCQATFIRFPVIAADEATRARALKRLSEAGIGASAFYPTAICDIPGIEQHMARRDFHRPASEDLARRLFTLPTHHLLEERDVKRMVEILSD
jgi:dTDP-4-amino-4,6-dideoxygalactose transaminase